MALTSILPPTPVRKIGARGETLFYYGPGITQSQSWDIGGRRVVDLIGPGRQTVLPPTIHPDTGVPYRWSGSESLENLQPHELPTLPVDVGDRITAALLPFGYRPEPPPHRRGNGGDGDSPHRQLNDEALANLDAWVPALMLYRCRRIRKGFEAVPTWRPSTTGRELKKRHLNLKIAPDGIRDFGADQGYTPLDLVMAACCCDLDTAFRFLSERLGWTLRSQPFQAAAFGQIERGDQADRRGSKCDPEPPIDELARFTAVPGLLGEIIDWIVATSRRPNRVLALGAAVTVVGTLIGRRAAGPTRSATHLYAVGIAPTANDCYAEFTRVVEAHVDEHQGSEAYLARCAETAVRLATIRAAGRWGRGASIELGDIEWGVGVSWTAGQALATAAQDFLPQNERGEMTEKILAYVRRKNPVKPRDIQQFLKGRLRSKDIKDILSQLVEAGEVEWQGDEYQPTAK